MADLQTRYKDSPNDRSYEDGVEFEDFACEQLAHKGIIIRIARSQRFQYEADSAQGLEFKRDNHCTGTGRLSIEYGERVNLQRPWVNSGILKGEKVWGYVQGNLRTFWFFNHRQLVMLYEWGKAGSTPLVFDEKPTVKTFYLPIELADMMAMLKYPRDWL